MTDPDLRPVLLDSDRIATLEAKLAVALDAIEGLRHRVATLEGPGITPTHRRNVRPPR